MYQQQHNDPSRKAAYRRSSSKREKKKGNPYIHPSGMEILNPDCLKQISSNGTDHRKSAQKKQGSNSLKKDRPVRQSTTQPARASLLKEPKRYPHSDRYKNGRCTPMLICKKQGWKFTDCVTLLHKAVWKEPLHTTKATSQTLTRGIERSKEQQQKRPWKDRESSAGAGVKTHLPQLISQL